MSPAQRALTKSVDDDADRLVLLELKELKLQQDKETEDLQQRQARELQALRDELEQTRQAMKDLEGITKEDWNKAVSEFSTEEMADMQAQRNQMERDFLSDIHNTREKELNAQLERARDELVESQNLLKKLQEEKRTLTEAEDLKRNEALARDLRQKEERLQMEIKNLEESKLSLERDYQNSIRRMAENDAIGNEKLDKYLKAKEESLSKTITEVERRHEDERAKLETQHRLELQQFQEYQKQQDLERTP